MEKQQTGQGSTYGSKILLWLHETQNAISDL